MSALHEMSLNDLSALIRRGEVSATEVTDAHIDRCAAMDGTAALVTPTFKQARETAQALDRELAQGLSRGPLHGLPLGLKDAIDVQDVPTRLCGRFTPDRDAATWQALRLAGMVSLSKLHCAEYCLGAPGAKDALPFAKNPHDPARTPGASSSGSAVALATGMVPAALGTDTGGSIRIPAAFCGVTGLKPTNGLLSRAGLFPLAPSLDQVGPMARDSRDCALLLDGLVGGADRYAAALSGGLQGLRIGHAPQFGRDAGAAEDQSAAVTTALEVLRALGAEIREVTLPPLQRFTECFLPIMLSEAYGLHEQAIAEDRLMSPNTRIRLEGGIGITPEAVSDAKTAQRALSAAMAELFTMVDALVFEAVPGDPPRIEAMHPLDYLKAPLLAVPANVTGAPSLAIRCGTSRAGLPIGLQILAARNRDATALRIGHAYESAVGHASAPVGFPPHPVGTRPAMPGKDKT